MEQHKINRINELARKSKKESLTLKEKSEQQKLRKEYIDSWKNGVRATLENVSILEPDGTVTPMRKKKNG